MFTAAQCALDQFGGVDLLVNNADYGHHRAFRDWDLDDMERMTVESERLVDAVIKALAKGKHEMTFPRFIAAGYVVRAIAPGFMRFSTKRKTLDALAKERR